MIGQAFLLFGLFLVIIFELGLVHSGVLPIGLNLVLVSVWLISLLSQGRQAVAAVVFLGFLLDIWSFSIIGIWIGILLGIFLAFRFIIHRYFDPGVIWQPLSLLFLGSFLWSITTGFLVGWPHTLVFIILGSLANCFIGYLSYYVIASRFQLFERWRSRTI